MIPNKDIKYSEKYCIVYDLLYNTAFCMKIVYYLFISYYFEVYNDNFIKIRKALKQALLLTILLNYHIINEIYYIVL